MAQLFYIGIKGLIKNDQGQYLLLKANTANHSKQVDPYWDIPGGRIEENEDAMSTLTREIFEETGINQLTDIEFSTAVISKHRIPLDNGAEAGLALHVYTVTAPVDAKIVIDPEEHTEYAWFDAVETAELLSNKYPPEFTDKLA